MLSLSWWKSLTTKKYKLVVTDWPLFWGTVNAEHLCIICRRPALLTAEPREVEYGTRLDRPKFGYWTHQTGQIVSTGQIESSNVFLGQTKQIRVIRYRPDKRQPNFFFKTSELGTQFRFSTKNSLPITVLGLRTSSRVRMHSKCWLILGKLNVLLNKPVLSRKGKIYLILVQISTTSTCTRDQPGQESSQISSKIWLDWGP